MRPMATSGRCVQDGVRDPDVRLLSGGGLYRGDRMRIYLPGTVLSSYNGMLQLDSGWTTTW